MTFEGAKELSRALMERMALRVLDLHENELEDRGALLIAKAAATIWCARYSLSGKLTGQVHCS